jgi:hypothetical protein
MSILPWLNYETGNISCGRQVSTRNRGFRLQRLKRGVTLTGQRGAALGRYSWRRSPPLYRADLILALGSGKVPVALVPTFQILFSC